MTVNADASEQDFLLLADDAGDVVDDSQIVVAHHLERDGILISSLAGPLRLDDAVAEAFAQLGRVGTSGAVDFDTSAACDKTEYVVAIDGLTATSHLKVQPLETFVDDQHVIGHMVR